MKRSAIQRKTPLQRTAPIARGTSQLSRSAPLERSAALAPISKAGAARKKAQQAERVSLMSTEAWAAEVDRLCGYRCVVTGRKQTASHERHHLIEKEALKRAGLARYINDPRLSVLVAKGVHDGHTSRMNALLRRHVPPAAWHAAAEIDGGLGWPWATARLEATYRTGHQSPKEG